MITLLSPENLTKQSLINEFYDTSEPLNLPAPPKIPEAPGEATLQRKKENLDSAYSDLINMGNSLSINNLTCIASKQQNVGKSSNNNNSNQVQIEAGPGIYESISDMSTKPKRDPNSNLKNQRTNTSRSDSSSNATKLQVKIAKGLGSQHEHRNANNNSTFSGPFPKNKKSFASSIMTNSDLEEISSLSSNEIQSIPRSPNTNFTPTNSIRAKGAKIRASSGNASSRSNRNSAKLDVMPSIYSNEIQKGLAASQMMLQNPPSISHETSSISHNQNLFKLRENAMNFIIKEQTFLCFPYDTKNENESKTKTKSNDMDPSSSNIQLIIPESNLCCLVFDENQIYLPDRNVHINNLETTPAYKLFEPEKNQNSNSNSTNLFCLHEIMAFPLLYITIETIGIEKVRHFVPIPKDKPINPDKDFNPFGKAGMMMYCALLLDHFVNHASTEKNNNSNQFISNHEEIRNYKFESDYTTSENIVKFVHTMIERLILKKESVEENPPLSCDNYMYNLKRVCAHDDLTLGHWLASKRCFPVQQLEENQKIENDATINTKIQESSLEASQMSSSSEKDSGQGSPQTSKDINKKDESIEISNNNTNSNNNQLNISQTSDFFTSNVKNYNNPSNDPIFGNKNLINNSQISHLKESLLVHASLDSFLQLSCTASQLSTSLQIIKTSINKIELLLGKKLHQLLNQHYLVLAPSLSEIEFLILFNGLDTRNVVDKNLEAEYLGEFSAGECVLVCARKSENFCLGNSIKLIEDS